MIEFIRVTLWWLSLKTLDGSIVLIYRRHSLSKAHHSVGSSCSAFLYISMASLRLICLSYTYPNRYSPAAPLGT